MDLEGQASGLSSAAELVFDRLIGVGLFAEPGFEQIFGQEAQGLCIGLGVDFTFEALHLKGLIEAEERRLAR